VNDLLVDVGLTKEEAETLTPIGTPIGYAPVYTELRGDYVAGKGMDDKCCAVPVLAAVSALDMNTLDCDIYFSLSAREEVGHRAVSAAAFRIRPDAAIVIDVAFGFAPEGKKPDDADMKGGPTVTLSALLDKNLTDFVIETAKKAEIPYQPIVDATETGTHADELVYAAGGIPTVLLGVPVWFMHTANEVVAIDGLKYTAKLLAAVIREKYGRKDG
jgi:endoglucanase